MALEEELQLDIGPALDIIRGELARTLDQIPLDFRSSFDDALQGIVQDFGAAADLARGELDRVFADPVAVAPVDVPVDVDTSQLDAVPGQIDDASAPVDVPVEVDDKQLVAAADEVKALDGETATVTIEADTSALADAQDQIDALSASSISGAGGPVGGGNTAAEAIGVRELSGAFKDLGGASLASEIAVGSAVGTVGLFAKEAIDAQFATASFKARVGDLADTLEKVNVGGLNTSLDALAVKVGANNENLRLGVARFVQLSDGSGRARSEVGNLGQSLVGLSAYLSTTNPQLGTADEIINRLPQALARGGRFLSQYGISLTTAEIQTRAFADTGKTAAADLTIFDKQAAGLELTMEKLGPSIASGISAGSDIAAVKLRSLRESLRETVVQAGEPIVDPLIRGLTALEPVIESIAKLVGSAGGAFADVLAPAIEVVGAVLTPVAAVLERVPKPILDVAAALYLGAKASAVYAAAADFVGAKVLAATAAIVTTEGPLATLEAAQIAAAAAAAANAEAQVALQVATGAAAAFAEADAAAEETKAAAMVAATAAADAEAAALTRVAAAEVEAESAIPPLLVAVAAGIAIFKAFSDSNAAFGISLEDLAALTDKELTDLYQKFVNLGQGGKFFKEIAGTSRETAIRLRDDLAAEGKDVTGLNKILDDSAKHDEAVAKGKALSTSETKKLTDALTGEDLAARVAAATSLKQSIGYDSLAQSTKDTVTGVLAAAAADDAAAKSAADHKKALEDEATAANDAAKAFDAAASALSGLIGTNFDSQQQELNYQIALDKTDAKIKDGIKSKGAASEALNLDTVAGRENVKTLQDLAKAQADIAAADIKAGEDPATVTARYQKQVDGLYDVYKQTGITKKAFEDYLATVGLLPAQLKTDVEIAGIPEAKTALDRFKSDVEKLPISIRVMSQFDAVVAYKQIVASLAQQGDIPVNVDAAAIAARVAEGVAAGLAATPPPQSPKPPEPRPYVFGVPNAEGNILAYAAGGIRMAEHYAQGGQAEDHTGQITTTQRVFGEPETGGEAYIPLTPTKRARSTQILGTVAEQFGYQLVPVGASRYADGMVIASGSGASWSDARMVDAIERVVTAIDSLPERIPRQGDTYNLPLDAKQQDTVRQIAERVVAASKRS